MILNSGQSNLSSEDVSSETGSAEEPKSRPATFSIDSVDSFCPDSIPTISVMKEETQTLVEVEEDNDDALFDSIGPEVSQVDGCLLPIAVLNDPALPVTSMLRKLSIQSEATEGEASRKHEEFFKTFRFCHSVCLVCLNKDDIKCRTICFLPLLYLKFLLELKVSLIVYFYVRFLLDQNGLHLVFVFPAFMPLIVDIAEI